MELELERFAIALADEDNSFAVILEKLALKKSSNNKVFLSVKKVFDKEFRHPEFKLLNDQYFKKKGGTFLKYYRLNTSVEQLRKKCQNLKNEWKLIT